MFGRALTRRTAAIALAAAIACVSSAPVRADAETTSYASSPVVISNVVVGGSDPTEIDVWAREATLQTMTMTLRGSTGAVLRTAPIDHQSGSTYLGLFRTGGLCAGSYTVRVANDADPSQWDEQALVLTTTNATSCDPVPDAPGRQESISLVSSTPVSLDRGDGRSPLAFFGHVHDALGAIESDAAATLVVASASGRQWRVAHVPMTPDAGAQVVRGLPLGTYRYWLERTEPDGTAIRSNSLELSTYRWTLAAPKTTYRLERRSGRPVRAARLSITASLPAMPPALTLGLHGGAVSVRTRITLDGTKNGGLRPVSFTVARVLGPASGMISSAALTFDGTVHGRFRPGDYGATACASVAGFEESSTWTTCRAVRVTVVDRG